MSLILLIAMSQLSKSQARDPSGFFYARYLRMIIISQSRNISLHRLAQGPMRSIHLISALPILRIYLLLKLFCSPMRSRAL